LKNLNFELYNNIFSTKLKFYLHNEAYVIISFCVFLHFSTISSVTCQTLSLSAKKLMN